MKAFCLFEQSGTFKNAFKKYGVDAEDFDILNDFGETDHVVDIFSQINKSFEGGQSIFDDMSEDDVCFSFFPCTRFECQVQMAMSGNAYQQKKWSEMQKLEYSMKLQKEASNNYELISKLAIISLRKKIKMVIENPCTYPHYLSLYWPIRPKIIDKDRREDGDFFKKPTQYWFLNFEPKNNLVFEPLDYVETRNIERTKGKNRQVERSMIHPQYAERFIRKYILEEENT